MAEEKVAPKVTLELVDGGIQVEGNLAPLQTILFLNEAIGAVTRDILTSAQPSTAKLAVEPGTEQN